MDRRTFFKLAGVGAGAIIIAPRFVLPEPQVPTEVPKEKYSIQRKVGYIYRGNTQIAAVANCGVEMYRPFTSFDTSSRFPEHYPTGPIETTITGDLLPLGDEHPHTLMGDGETLQIILAFPQQGDMKIDAEGLITSIGLESSMDSPAKMNNTLIVHSFIFEIFGEIIMSYT